MPGVLEDDTSSVKDTSSVTSRFPTLAQRPREAGKTGVCVSRRGEERGGSGVSPCARPHRAPSLPPRPRPPSCCSPPCCSPPCNPGAGDYVGGEPREVAGFDAPVIPTPPREAFSVGNNNECRKKEKKMETGKNKSEFQYLLPAVTVKSPRSRCQEKVPRTLEG